MDTTLSQAAEFAAAVYCGLCIGILFDIFAILHSPFKNVWVHSLLDAIFYAAAGVIAGSALLFINGGEIRLWLLLIIAAAAFLYRFTAGALFRALIKKLRPTKNAKKKESECRLPN
jgi:spore cortex biosynthesis protein YabQ